MISPLAYIQPEAKIDGDGELGPCSNIDANVVVGDSNKLMNSVTLLSGTRIGNGNTFFPGAVIGAVPQDLKFRGEETTAEIGDNNTIRENVTINRGTAAKGKTVVGSNNLLMEGMHVGHDCIVGNGCILGNSTKIAGEVVIDDFAILSANVLVHQFCHIGSYVMVSGGTRTAQDVPPFCIAAREPVAYCGLNMVGLKRRNFSLDVINALHSAFLILYQNSKLFNERIEEIRTTVPKCKEVDYLLDFLVNSKRGFIGK